MVFSGQSFEQEHGWRSTRVWMQDGVEVLDSACTDSSKAAILQRSEERWMNMGRLSLQAFGSITHHESAG
jgi:hypothetical protein